MEDSKGNFVKYIPKVKELVNISVLLKPLIKSVSLIYSFEELERIKKTDSQRYLRILALQDFLHNDFFSKNDKKSPNQLFLEKFLSTSLLLELYEKNILYFKEYAPKEVIASQGEPSKTIMFTFSPVEVYYNNQLLNVVNPYSLIGEGGIFGISKETEFRMPSVLEFPKNNLLAIIDTILLKKYFPLLFKELRLEIFISFLEKLHITNRKKESYIAQLESLGLPYSHIMEPKSLQIVGETPLETFLKSPLFDGINTDMLLANSAIIKSIVKIEHYPRGKKIIESHQEPQKIVVIHSGKVAIVGDNGEILDYAQGGEVVGESIITGTPTIANVVADEDVYAATVYKDLLFETPLTPIFFKNCFKLLKKKLIHSGFLTMKLEKLLEEKKVLRYEEDNQKTQKSKRTITKKEVSSKEEIKKESSKFSLRSFTSRMAQSLEGWLGRNVEEKDQEELDKVLENLQKKLETSKIIPKG